MAEWIIRCLIGSVSCVIGYFIGRGHAMQILREAKKALDQTEELIREGEELKSEVWEMLNEQQTEGR